LNHLKLLLSILILSTSTLAHSLVLDFEDLFGGGPETQAPMPSDYAGFNWSSSAYYQTAFVQPGTGYEFGTLDYVSLFNSDAAELTFSSADVFTFKSAYLTSAWNEGETITVQGLLGGAVTYSTDVVVSYSSAELFNFDFVGIDTVRFVSDPADGAPAGLPGVGSHIVIDNIQLESASAPPPSGVPEPSGLALLVAPFAFAAAGRLARSRGRKGKAA
jgi:hypothetical protein